jgi:hypothetical protein
VLGLLVSGSRVKVGMRGMDDWLSATSNPWSCSVLREACEPLKPKSRAGRFDTAPARNCHFGLFVNPDVSGLDWQMAS